VTGQIFAVSLSPKGLDILFKNAELRCFTVYWLRYEFAVGTFSTINSSGIMELFIY